MKLRIVLLGIVAAALCLGAGTAYAYFTSSASGSAAARAGSLLPVSIEAIAGTPGTPLLPGSTGDVTLTVNNPNTFDVTLVAVSGSGAITAVGNAACTADSGVTFNPPSGPGLLITPGINHLDLAGAAAMSTTSSASCQGATFSIPVTVTVQR
jgi:predicted ribosomally synthesized peptide with SipW-like signal peptide